MNEGYHCIADLINLYIFVKKANKLPYRNMAILNSDKNTAPILAYEGLEVCMIYLFITGLSTKQ